MRKMDYNGKKVDAEVMDFEIIKPEAWAVFKLADGTIVKAKLAVTEILKFVDEYRPDGEPIYYVQAGTAVTSQALPENLQHAKPKFDA